MTDQKEIIPQSKGPLLDFLFPLLSQFSLDLVKIIAEYHDIIQLFNSRKSLSLQGTSLHVCPMCISVDSNRIHFIFKDFDYNTSTNSLIRCHCCLKTPENDHFINYNTNMIFQTDGSVVFNIDGSFKLVDSSCKPKVNCYIVCNECLSRDLHNYPNIPCLSVSHTYFVVSAYTGWNRCVFFCPYLLAMLEDPRQYKFNVVSCIQRGLISFNSEPHRQDRKALDEHSKKMLSKFGDAHCQVVMDKHRYASKNDWVCAKCKLRPFRCMVCLLDKDVYCAGALRLCDDSMCWGLFFGDMPQMLSKSDEIFKHYKCQCASNVFL
jgi:hypothetical protein